MSQTLNATFEGGVFKLLEPAPLSFSEGEHVTLTVLPGTPPATASAASEKKDGIELMSRVEFERRLRSGDLSGLSELQAMLLKLRADEIQTKYPQPNTIIKDIEEATEFVTGPRVLREAIKDQFLAVIGEVKDLKPVEPKNRFQRRARTALALFSNLSSLFVYLILIVSALKLLFLFASHNGRIVQAFDNSKYTMTPMILFMILICLLTVRLLHGSCEIAAWHR